jgi:hypothetical protein
MAVADLDASRMGEVHEDVHDGGVELGSLRLPQSNEGGLRRHGPAVRAVAGHGMKGVDDQDDPSLQRDLLVPQAVGVPAAVPVLVARPAPSEVWLPRFQARPGLLSLLAW